MVVERETRERWVQGGQNPAFVRFDSVSEWIHVRTRGRPLESRDWWYLDVRSPGWEGSLQLDPRNRLISLRLNPPAIEIREATQPGQRDGWHYFLRNLRGRIVGLWEVPVPRSSEPLAPGVTWVDTLTFSVEPDEKWLESLHGIWQHQVVGDTLLDGRSLPLVRTVAEVTRHLFEAVPDAGVEGDLVVERTVSGRLTGWAAVDTALGLRAAGRDSADWEGVATIHLQDGRSFDAPLRYQRLRSWRLTDSIEWAARQDSLRSARQRQRTGMLILPVTRLQERLAGGDSILVDSLKAEWLAAGDPNQRGVIEGLLRLWGERGLEQRGGIRIWLENARWELGDTATILADRLSGGSWLESLTEGELEERLPYLDDPGRLWQLGVTPRWTYSTLATGLLDDTPILQPDTADWSCTPAACERVISLLETASEPRLRDVALVTAFARDPATWYDRLLARADSGSLVVRGALLMGQGVGATWPAALVDPVPVPPPGASWRVWLSWLGGEVRFETSHTQALRMYEARTGRQVLEELRRRWPPDGDSAQVILGTILRGTGTLDPPTHEELAAELLSGSGPRVKAAQGQLPRLVPPIPRRSQGPDSLRAPERVVAQILSPLLDSLMTGGRAPWPGLDAEGSVVAEPSLPLGGFHGVQGASLFLVDENLPPGFVPSSESGFELIGRVESDARPAREGGVLLSVTPLTTVGPFATVSWAWTALERRGPDEAPSGYAGGATIWLLKEAQSWIVVSVMHWIT